MLRSTVMYVAMMGVLSAPLGGCSSATPFGWGEAENPADHDAGSGRTPAYMFDAAEHGKETNRATVPPLAPSVPLSPPATTAPAH